MFWLLFINLLQATQKAYHIILFEYIFGENQIEDLLLVKKVSLNRKWLSAVTP